MTTSRHVAHLLVAAATVVSAGYVVQPTHPSSRRLAINGLRSVRLIAVEEAAAPTEAAPGVPTAAPARPNDGPGGGQQRRRRG